MAYWCIDPVSGNDGTGASAADAETAALTRTGMFHVEAA